MELIHHRAGSGPPLVLVHGIGSRWQVWEPVLDRLATEREVIAPDLPGFGASPMPPVGTPPGIASLTRILVEFLDRLGLERPHVAGNSLGGWLALELAKQGRARSATTLSPAGFHANLEQGFQHASLWLAYRGARLLAPRAESVLSRPRARKLLVGQLIGRPERMTPAQAAADMRALASAPWFEESLAAVNVDRFRDGDRIDVPVTIAWGERDHLLLPHQARRAGRAIPRARVIVLRGCGHVPTYDDPSQVAQVLLEGSSI